MVQGQLAGGVQAIMQLSAAGTASAFIRARSLEYLDKTSIRFVKVGYLKELVKNGQILPRAQDLDPTSHFCDRPGVKVSHLSFARMAVGISQRIAVC